MPLNTTSQSDDDYSLSESDDYTENEKKLLNRVTNKSIQHSESEDEVYAIQSADEDSESDDKSDFAASDIEGQEDDELPDIRAWGKDKRQFYKTDYVDPDYGGFQGKDAHLADLEEQEARNIQKQLAEQLDDDDFSLNLFSKKPVEDEKITEEIIKTDISKLSKRQKLQILQKESPELFSLIEDYKSKMILARDYLCPVLQRHKAGQLPQSKAVDFVKTQYGIILNYCLNIYMYLYLKATKTNIQNHPVIKRLFQYRQLLLNLEQVFEEIIKPQIDIIISEESTENKSEEIKDKKKKTLKLLASLTKNRQESILKQKKREQELTSQSEDEVPVKKKVKFADTICPEKIKGKTANGKVESADELDDTEEEANVEENIEVVEDKVEAEAAKRAITYQMAKNKGLTPHRKREQRNPRVKHRMKYQKAVKRRKGAVREPRKELSRYGGEISGIKANVSRSVKIKT